jgi:hypothetical protein
MRRFVLAIVLSLAATGGALAYCPLYPADTPGGKIAAQTDKAVCEQQELSATTAQKSQQLNVQSNLNDALKNLEQEQRMQQMFNQQQQLFNLPTTP